MNHNSWKTTPSSFDQTVRLVEDFVIREIVQETKAKQLYYHTIDHALDVQRRAKSIFTGIKFVLQSEEIPTELDRLACLLQLCALAHDMVQQFSLSQSKTPRKRIPGISETATADKLIEYIKNLNQKLSSNGVNASCLFDERDLATLEEGILATICDRDPLAGKARYSFSNYSIYQPYLYNSPSQTSLIGKIIALADLGTLGMDGVEPYIKEGILVFLEDNLDLKKLILNCTPCQIEEVTRLRLLNMTRFIVDLAKERKARFEVEIAGFNPQARLILREQIFIHLNSENIAKIQTVVPTNCDASAAELLDFFCLNKNNSNL